MSHLSSLQAFQTSGLWRAGAGLCSNQETYQVLTKKIKFLKTNMPYSKFPCAPPQTKSAQQSSFALQPTSKDALLKGPQARIHCGQGVWTIFVDSLLQSYAHTMIQLKSLHALQLILSVCFSRPAAVKILLAHSWYTLGCSTVLIIAIGERPILAADACSKPDSEVRLWNPMEDAEVLQVSWAILCTALESTSCYS